MGVGTSALANLVIDAGFWAGRRVLVTGHTGFKGSWLSLWLAQLGAEVTGISDAVLPGRSLYVSAGVEDDVTSVAADVRDLTVIRGALAKHEPEVVFHLAAQPLVRAAYRRPVETFETNVLGTVNVLEAIRETTSVRAAVIVTTDKVYENRGWEWGYRENEPKGGDDPYSASKACAEMATAAYRRSFFSQKGTAFVASARAGNVIGGGDWAEDRLIPDFMRAARDGRAVEIRHPQAVRPWQHVLNPLSGYLLLAQQLWGGDIAHGAWNFGPDDADTTAVDVVLDRLAALMKGAHGWTVQPGEHPHEANVLKLDSSRARSRLGWRTVWHLDDTLAATVSWYEAEYEGHDMREVTSDQIGRFSMAMQATTDG